MDQWQSQEPDPDIRIQEGSWKWPEATPGQRAAAWVLDLLIIIATWELLKVINSRVNESSLPAAFQFLFSTVYFIVLHHRSGQTFGKKALGIRVVGLADEDAESRLPFSQVLLRETVGRFISGALLFAGYLRIIIKADRRGFHDLIGKTRVISTSQSNSKPIKFRYIFAGFVLLAVVVVGGYSYTIFYTSFPLKGYAKALEANGYRIEGVHGSLVKGFAVDQIAFSNDDVDFSISGASISYDWRNSNEKTDFIINSASVTSARVNFKKAINFGPSRASDARADGPFGSQGKSARGEKANGVFTLKSLDLNDVEVTMPGRPTYRLERLVLTDVQSKSADQSLFIGQVHLDSRLLVLNASEIAVSKNKISFLKALEAQIQPGLYPELLKSPIDIELIGDFENLKPTNVRLSAFSKRVQLSFQGDRAEAHVSQFTPFHYLKTDLPIWDISLNIAGDLKTGKMDQVSGSVGVRHVRFDLNAANFTYLRGTKIFTLLPRMAADWRGMLAGTDPGFVLGSSDHGFSRDVLSELYYAKPIAKLAVVEKDTVDRDARFFSDSLDAGLAKPVPINVAKSVQDNRAPSSVKKNASKYAPSRGVPTKLPPYRKRNKK